MAYTGINFNRARMPARQGIIDPSRMGRMAPQMTVAGGSMRQGIVSTPTMREAIMQTQPTQSVAEILSEPLGEMTPNLGAATSAASRQRQIADMLMQGAMAQDNTSIAGGLSQLGQAFLARRAGQKADTAEDKQREMASLLMQQAMGEGPESQAARAQLFADNPAAMVAQSDAQRATQAEQQRTQMQNEMLANLFPEGSQQRAMLLAGVGTTEAAKQAFAPPPEPVQYDSAADAMGVRRYTEGPDIGQPVPGFETPRPDRGGMSFSLDENGNPVIVFGGAGVPSVFGKSGESAGAKAFSTALEDAGTSDATLALANQARKIIEGGYNSGIFAPIIGEARRVGREIGLGDPEKVADYEQFSAINSQLAAQMLKLFGGSDTERELAISISSNIGPRFDEATNKRMLDALDQAIAIQRSKPEHIAQWTRRLGSLDAIDPQTGLGFQATWDRYLQNEIPNMSGAASSKRQTNIEAATQGVLNPEELAELQRLRQELGMQ